MGALATRVQDAPVTAVDPYVRGALNIGVTSRFTGFDSLSVVDDQFRLTEIEDIGSFRSPA